MQVDFYQLPEAADLAPTLAKIAARIVGQGERLIVVHGDENALAKIDRLLWSDPPTSFLPHAMADSGRDSEQPVLLSTSPVAANKARNMLIADGEWREAATGFARTFYLFDESTIATARAAWSGLAGREAVERRYWALAEGRWTQKA